MENLIDNNLKQIITIGDEITIQINKLDKDKRNIYLNYIENLYNLNNILVTRLYLCLTIHIYSIHF